MATVITWSFETSEEGWTVEDLSVPPSTNTYTHDTPKEAMIEEAYTISNNLSRAWLVSPDLSFSLEPGDTIAMDFSAVYGPNQPSTTRKVKAIYTDLSEENVSAVGTTAGTLTLTVAVTKTLQTIKVLAFDRIAPGPESSFCDVLEVRLDSALTSDTGYRPLEIDIDLAGGTKRWITFWEAGAIKLREYNGSLVAQTTASFTTGTATTDISNRTFYMSPYAPPFFETSGLDDIIYVFGRWDDGNVQHIHKSTDGASSFSDIGDSATWLAGWVGAFFADDTNTLYAFVNGASRALYRSTDGGSNWTSLSSLPFDVDPGGMTVHPDGRILISNRAAGAQTAAYSIAPNYPSWVDATGTPSFPSSTPGSGSNAIIWVT